MLVLVLFSCYGVARAYVLTHNDSYAAQMKADQNAPGQFPARIGSYTLSRSWNENLFTGPLVFHWAEYVPDGWRNATSPWEYRRSSAPMTR